MLEQGAQLPPGEDWISAEHCSSMCVLPVEEWQAECCEHTCIRGRLDSCGGPDGRLVEDQG